MADPAQQIRALADEIRRHDYRYYVLTQPTVSDQEYDALLRQLRALEDRYPDLAAADSPTQRVAGQPIAGFTHVRHTVPMLSIDNTYSPAELKEFDDRVRRTLEDQPYRYLVDPKIDGVAAALRYERGALAQVATRGDGLVGDDITHSARTIRAIPLTLLGDDPPELLEVRGEIYWPLSEFARFNRRRAAAGEPTFANPRNATAGTLKQLDPRSIEGRGLSFCAHGFGAIRGRRFETHSQVSEHLRAWGIPVSPDRAVVDSVDRVLELVADWEHRRGRLDYLMDGLVIKIDSLAQRDQLGATSRYPRWCIAYKFAAEQADTQIRDVTLQVGKLGTITPVAELEPVLLAGTTVRRASLHNFDQIDRLDVRIGDTVVIQKAGEIIPQVVSVVAARRPAKTQPIRRPRRCPVCSGTVARDEDGVLLRCTNPGCPAQLRERLIFFCARNQMDIDGAGPALIDQLLTAGLVGEYADLYRLADRRDQLIDLPRMGPKRVDNLLAGIERSKSQPLARLLAALNIPHVGGTTAELLADHFEHLSAVCNATEAELTAVAGIGPELAGSVRHFFDAAGGRDLVQALAAVGVNMGQPAGDRSDRQPLAGQTVVVTGTLEHYSRTDIERLIKRLGGKASAAVSKKTAFLVAGDNAGSKLAKARELGIPVLSEQEFQERFAGAAAR